MNLLPAIIFLVGCGLAFATGTSWGTFGILIPIVVSVFQGQNETMMIIPFLHVWQEQCAAIIVLRFQIRRLCHQQGHSATM